MGISPQAAPAVSKRQKGTRFAGILVKLLRLGCDINCSSAAKNRLSHIRFINWRTELRRFANNIFTDSLPWYKKQAQAIDLPVRVSKGCPYPSCLIPERINNEG